MALPRRRFLAQLLVKGAAIPLLWQQTASALARIALIENFRYYRHDQYTRAVFESTHRLSPQLQQQEQTLTIYLPNVSASGLRSYYRLEDVVLASLTVERVPNASVLTFALHRPVRLYSFLIPAKSNQSRHRFVIDFKDNFLSEDAAIFSPLRVVIDAGHGGKDPGAIGPGGLQEKTPVLAIAKRLAERVNRHRGMQAFLTRDQDVFLSLKRRLELAREFKANLFISIHADAVPRPQPSGASVYALSLKGATSEAARLLAKSENSSSSGKDLEFLREQDAMVAATLLNMSQTATIRGSLILGEKILQQLEKIGGLHFKTVQQANFFVLRLPDIPSLLVESAFISNPEEEKKLQSTLYQQQLAESIFQGIRAFAVEQAMTGGAFVGAGFLLADS
jgi:N-acetylmuramoyl-L-alanine amidase